MIIKITIVCNDYSDLQPKAVEMLHWTNSRRFICSLELDAYKHYYYYHYYLVWTHLR